MDVIIPVRPGQQDDYAELRYCLRLEANLTDLGDVYACGGKPAWLNTSIAKWVPAVEWHAMPFLNRDANIIDSMLAGCAAGVGKQFLKTFDHNILLHPTTSAELLPCHGDDILQHEHENCWNTRWKRRGAADRLLFTVDRQADAVLRYALPQRL